MLFGPLTPARELARREIDLLLHSTHLTINLPQMFADGLLDTARGLRTRLGDKAERLLHDPARLEKFAVGLDYINASVTTSNFELLYARSRSAWQVEWVHLVLDLKLLEREDTLFCPVSAAQDFGAHVTSGVAGLQSMFAEQVEPWTRSGLTKSEPTHPQAEVLIKGALDLAHVRELLVSSGAIEDEVQRLAAHYHRKVTTRVSPKHFLWPARLKHK